MNRPPVRPEEAAARAATVVRAAHAQLCHSLAARFSDRVDPGRTVDIYCTRLGLRRSEAAWLRRHTCSYLGLGPRAAARDAAERLHSGILRYQDWARLQLPSYRDPLLREAIERQLAHCRDIIANLHARCALQYVGRNAGDVRTALDAYIQVCVEDDSLRSAVHALAVARLARVQRRVLARPASELRLPRRSLHVREG